MLTDLPQVGFAVGLGHPIFRLDFDFGINLLLELLFQIMKRHGKRL
jgi:hypothetical protein